MTKSIKKVGGGKKMSKVYKKTRKVGKKLVKVGGVKKIGKIQKGGVHEYVEDYSFSVDVKKYDTTDTLLTMNIPYKSRYLFFLDKKNNSSDIPKDIDSDLSIKLSVLLAKIAYNVKDVCGLKPSENVEEVKTKFFKQITAGVLKKQMTITNEIANQQAELKALSKQHIFKDDLDLKQQLLDLREARKAILRDSTFLQRGIAKFTKDPVITDLEKEIEAKSVEYTKKVSNIMLKLESLEAENKVLDVFVNQAFEDAFKAEIGEICIRRVPELFQTRVSFLSVIMKE